MTGIHKLLQTLIVLALISFPSSALAQSSEAQADQRAALMTERLNDASLARAIAMELATAGDDFSGAVLVARRGQVIFSSAQGLADRAGRIRNTATTRFRVGSMDKMFTGVTVMQLVQAGRMDLQAPLSAYLPDYPNRQLAEAVTIEQLLLHTGGTGDIFGPEFDVHRNELRVPDDYVRLYGSRPPAFPPGSSWDYSNYGYILLGRVIETVSGQPFDAYLQAHVFAPAGMTGTGFEPESVAVPERAVAYEKIDGVFNLAAGLPWRGTPAGGGYSTILDLNRFVAALYDGRLLDRRHLEALTLGRIEDDGMRYGYGFATYPSEQPTMIGHAGGAPGMSGDLRILGDGEVTIVVLSNVAPPYQAGRLGKFIATRVRLH